MYFNDQVISSGTGFVIFSCKGPMLITNRHNVTGRDQKTNKCLSNTWAIPNKIKIYHNYIGVIGKWAARFEDLYDEESPRWIEHPTLGKDADFIALPLNNINNVQMHAYDPACKDPEILIGPSESVSVVGFPFGLRSGGSFAVWATGFIASEPYVDHDSRPIFLIDCRTRPGQSGSAVIAYRGGGVVAKKGGVSSFYDGPVYQFLGIYSGRVNPESDIGIVWKSSAILELLESI